MPRFDCICRAAVRRAVRDSDAPDEVLRKQLIIPVMFGTFALSFGSFMLDTASESKRFRGRWCGETVIWGTCLVGLFGPLITRRLSLNFTSVLGTALAVGTVMVDWYNASSASGRLWPTIVLIMDFFLALGVGRGAQGLILHGTALWLIVDSIEAGFRLGVYDGGYLNEGYSDAWRSNVDCAKPPCAYGGFTALLNIGIALLMLYVDFFATRGFADGLRGEKAKALTAVQIADQVTYWLARFDLEAAEGALDNAGAGLSEGLEGSLRRLLRNLSCRYRPYLPQSVFEEDDDTPNADVSSAASRELQPTETSVISSGAANSDTPRSPRKSRFSVLKRIGTERSLSSAQSPARRNSDIAGADGHAAAQRTSHRPQVRKVALLARNTRGMLPAVLQSEPGAVAQWVAAAVEQFGAAVRAQNGVTDLLSGDHLSASFGAVKVQGTQCVNAVRAAETLRVAPAGDDLPITRTTVAVCAGKALCGDFGSHAAQRFMVLGGVSAFLPCIERVAAAWGTGVLVDSVVQADAEQHWDHRLRKRVLFPKVSAKPIWLWEVVTAKVKAAEPEEWMYELQSQGANEWLPYNVSMQKWCDEGAEVTLRFIAGALGSGALGGRVAAALQVLSEHVQRHPDAIPQVSLTAATFAGEPTPVTPRCDILQVF